MHVVLDARMVKSSGIGRYLQLLIPMLARNRKIRLTLLGDPAALRDYPCAVIAFHTPVYSPLEQFRYPKVIPHCDLFWSPHYNAPLLRIPAVKRLTTVHDVFHITRHSVFGLFRKAYAALLLKNAVRKSDAVIAVSAATRQEMKKHLGLSERDRDKITVIHHYPDARFRKTGTDPRKIRWAFGLRGPFLLTVANVKPHKNILGLLRAFALLKKNMPKLSLLVVGQKEGLLTGIQNMDAIIAALDLGDRVRFTGPVSDGDLVALYNAAEALVFPSFYEGFGFPPLEAMACGCPAIVSPIPTLLETCGDSAYYVNPYSPESIAKGITAVLTDKTLRSSLIDRGFRNLRHYTRDKTEKKTMRLVKELAGGGHV